MASLPVLGMMIVGIVPGLKLEASATATAGRTPNRRATVATSAQATQPSRTDTASGAKIGGAGPAITGLYRATIRDCQILLGRDGNQVAGAACELSVNQLQ